MVAMLLAGTPEQDGINLPDDPGSAVVWVLMLGVIVGLYFLIRRTRMRAEEDFEERRRRRDGTNGPDKAR